MKAGQWFPALEWLKAYKFRTFGADTIAGITVWIMLVPQAMAYAMLAGMPPIYGLYAGLLPLFIYGLLGTSRQLSLGPVAVSSLLVLAGISQVAEPGTQEYISLVILAGLLIGITQFLMGLFRLGFLANFLSYPIITGFTSAAAIIIGLSQVKYLLGIPIPRFNYLPNTITYAINHISEIHWPSFLLCTGGIIIILLLRRINRSIPGALIVTVLGIVLVLLLNLHNSGVNIVGTVPEGLPAFQIPDWTMEKIRLVTPTVLTVSLIGVVESISIAKVLEAKNKDHKVIPDQELRAMGIAKLFAAFFQALPTSASFTRSAINDDAGAKTGVSSMISALLMALTLIFLTPLFYYLPEAILASIILVAVKGLFKIKEAKRLWYIHKQDFFMMLLTFLLTLMLGIEKGVLIGVLLSLGMIIYRSTNPHIAILGQLPDSERFRNISRFKNAIQFEGILIFRFDAQLFFGNANYFKNCITNLVNDYDEPLDLFILDASSIYDIDSSGLLALEEIAEYMKADETRFVIAAAIGPVRDLMHKIGLIDKIGKENHFMYIQDAIKDHRQSTDSPSNYWKEQAIQTNIKK